MRGELSCRRGADQVPWLQARQLRPRLRAVGDLGAQLVTGVQQEVSPHGELASLCEPCQLWPCHGIAASTRRQHLPLRGRVRGWLLIRLLQRCPALLQVP